MARHIFASGTRLPPCFAQHLPGYVDRIGRAGNNRSLLNLRLAIQDFCLAKCHIVRSTLAVLEFPIVPSPAASATGPRRWYACLLVSANKMDSALRQRAETLPKNSSALHSS